MITKRYKIITAADPISSAMTGAGEAVEKGVETSPYNAALGIPTIKNELNKWYQSVSKQEAGQEVINTINQAKQAFENEEKLINALSARMGWSPDQTASYIAKLSPMDYSNPEATMLDRETLIEALLTVFDATSSMGLQGNTTKVIEYFEMVLQRSGDAKSAASKVAEDMSKIGNLANEAKISVSQMFDIYFTAVKTNNFSPVYAMIAVIPLLGKNWWSLTERVSINVNQMNAFMDLAERFQGVKLDLSPAGKIVKKLNQSFNNLKIAWLPIKKYIDMVLLTKVAKWNDVKTQRYKDNKERYQAFLSWQRGVEYDLHKFQDQFKFVNMPTSEAPGANILKDTSKRGANLIKKYKVVMAAGENVEQASNDINTLKMQALETLQQEAVSKYTEITNLYARILDSVKAPETPAGGATSLTVFMSAFGTDEAVQACNEILQKMQELYQLDMDIAKQYDAVTNDSSMPAAMITKIRNDKSKFRAEYQARVTNLRTMRSNVEKMKIILPHVKQIQIKTKRLSTMQKAFAVPSNKFMVPIVEVNPGGQKSSGGLKVRFVTRATAALEIWNLGMQLSEEISGVASEFGAVKNENFQATAQMMEMQAQDLANEMNTWKDTEFMKGRGSQLSANPQ